MDIIHSIINRHEESSRVFESDSPDSIAKFCFHEDKDSSEVIKHLNGTDNYPSVTRTPSVLMRVPTYTVPPHTVTYIDDAAGVEKTINIDGFSVIEHYEFISGCSSYAEFLNTKQDFEDNIEASNGGTFVPNVNPQS